jgi:hypothetical protein
MVTVVTRMRLNVTLLRLLSLQCTEFDETLLRMLRCLEPPQRHAFKHPAVSYNNMADAWIFKAGATLAPPTFSSWIMYCSRSRRSMELLWGRHFSTMYSNKMAAVWTFSFSFILLKCEILCGRTLWTYLYFMCWIAFLKARFQQMMTTRHFEVMSDVRI